LSKVAGKVFRIGHLGNDLMLMGLLCGVEMGFSLVGVPHRKGGAQVAIDYLATPWGATTDGGRPRSWSARFRFDTNDSLWHKGDA